MRFVLLIEGYTERALPPFLKRWLDARLPQKIGVTAVRFEGWAELRREVARRTHLYLNSPKANDIIGVVALIDLYGPTFYPAHLTTAVQKYDWAKADIEREVGHPKFRQFFAVHETEAWLLSQPDIFPDDISSGFPGRAMQPETVNFQEPPAKLLDRLYRTRLKRTYKKVVNGKELFDRLDPNVAYDMCPKLKEMLDEMLSMALSAVS